MPSKDISPAKAEDTRNMTVITAVDPVSSAIRDIVEESDEEPIVWHAGSLEMDERYRSMFELPEQLRPGPKQDPRAREYAYCWVDAEDKKTLQMYFSDNWRAVNRTNHPYLPRSLFGSEGAIVRGKYHKHILMYQRRLYNETRKRAAEKEAERTLETAKSSLENMRGPVVFEEITSSSGYGVTPDSPPITMGWDGNSGKE